MDIQEARERLLEALDDSIVRVEREACGQDISGVMERISRLQGRILLAKDIESLVDINETYGIEAL